VEEATLLTLEDVNLKDLHIRVHRLKHGVNTQKPLWRHNAKLVRSYLRGSARMLASGSLPAGRDP
jgi:integrase